MNKNNCILCGAPLKYKTTSEEMACEICGRKFMSAVCCENGHFICDECHSKKSVKALLEMGKFEKSNNPIEIMYRFMDSPDVYMHGPEHHVLVGAALLIAYSNAGGKIHLEAALKEMMERGKEVPGGACGFWGCCGASVSAGIFFSIITDNTPMEGESWGICMKGTSRVLNEIGKVGGPRCCKRNSSIAIREAARFVNKELCELTGFEGKLELPDKIRCRFFMNNKECLKTKCPFYPGKKEL